MPKRVRMDLIWFTIRVCSVTRFSRSRFGRRASSSSAVGIAAMLQWRFSPRSQPTMARISISVSRGSVFAPVFARPRHARRMDNVGLDLLPPQPARQPEAVASGFVSDDDALDRVPGSAGFVAPAMQDLEQHVLVDIELLKGLAFDARNKRRNEPARLAHLDYGDNCAILVEGGEGPVRVKRLRHGGLLW